MPRTTPFVLIVDFEATCDDRENNRVPRDEMEIIEIGACVANASTGLVTSTYQGFVRPVRHPELTEFCKTLTGIEQQHVNTAPSCPDAMAQWGDWLDRHAHECAYWGSWGQFDARIIERDCRSHDCPSPLHGLTHVNIKELDKHARGSKKGRSLGKALRGHGLQFVGNAHRGMDDAVNIARLLPRIWRD